jgi:putative ABC transport system permease protein
MARVVRALDRKLLRDLWQLKGQALAIAAVIGAGVAMFIAYLSTFASLQRSQDQYYDRYRFADVFAPLARAPLSLRSDIAAIPGVQAIETRVVANVTLDVPRLDEPALGRLVSIPVPARPMLNALVLRRGRLPETGRSDEVLASEAFVNANQLAPGDTVGAIINGRRRALRIVGVALSPEYIISIRPGELIADDRRFGILWMERRALATAFDMEGGFNDVALTLEPGAELTAVIDALDRLLQPYGGLGAIPRSLQVSSWTIANELKQLRSLALAIPIVFLGVAAFLLNVVLTRIVSVQREQIAALKALGYANREIGWHFVKWSLAVGCTGSLLGIAGGMWMGSKMTGLYNLYFKFPDLDYRLAGPVVVAAVAVSLAAAVLGALGAVRRAVRLPPAEAMRPESPPRYRASLLERFGVGRLFGPPGRMVVRNVERQPVRTLTSVIGIGFASALLVLGLFFLDAIDELMRIQFSVVQRQDVMVSFVEPRSAGAFHELQRLPGVLAVEPARALPVRIRAGHRSRQIALSGLTASPQLQRVVDIADGPLTLPPSGLVLSRTLADLLGVAAGDTVDIEVLEGWRPRRSLRVARLVDEHLGLSAYMDAAAVNRLMREAGTLSGAYLLVDPAHERALHQRLKAIPSVAGVALTRAALETFRKQMDETVGVFVGFNILFASTIAFGVVYNAARISLSERSRELASLRVLGFTRAEISSILLGELALLTLAGVPIGLAMGAGLARLLMKTFDTELYRFPVVIDAGTYATAAVVTLLAALVSGLLVRRKLDHLDLVQVLKSRE